jgi:aminopeptidase N
MVAILAGAVAALLLAATAGRADEPYARTRDYDLQHVLTSLKFNLAERRITGETIQDLVALRDGVAKYAFDSVGLQIEGVLLNGASLKYEVADSKLVVTLPHASRTGEKYQFNIHYTGQPKRGIYFVLPDKNYPNRPAEIWTQGEAEDTRYYIPIYDYPNDRTTSEMIATVPKDWITVSNGKLNGVKENADGTKTWDWVQDKPLSTYLISLVAGQFDEVRDTWRGIPVTYEVPRGRAATIEPTFARTKQMLELFSDKLGVPYPWSQYAQANVDEFVEGGMENTSATTLTAGELLDPRLAPEIHEGTDYLISHEMLHQWFGDLVTCNDWANLWLNEGFATFAEFWWEEHQYGANEAAYTRWKDARGWMANSRMFTVPVVTRDFTDSMELEPNIYDKAGLIIQMLRERMGDDAFFRSLHAYLEAHRDKNVVTSDLVKSIDDTTAMNFDQFFDEWIYGAGAPRFRVHANYDPENHEIKLRVEQTQKADGAVHIFHVPVEVEVGLRGAAPTSYWINVSRADETFTVAAAAEPTLVIFDKGDKILSSVDMEKTPAEWIFQLQHADAVANRLDATVALGNYGSDENVITALGVAARGDAFWGVRAEAVRALGKIGSQQAGEKILEGLASRQPVWVREIIVNQLGRFPNVPSATEKVAELYRRDEAFGVRSAALNAMAQLKAPEAFDTLKAAIDVDAPRSMMRNAALRGFGTLGDERAVPIVLEWAQLGRPLGSRAAAIASLARLSLASREVESQLIGYVSEPYPGVRAAALRSLGLRGDPSAIAPLEVLLHNGAFGGVDETLAASIVQRLKMASRPSGN